MIVYRIENENGCGPYIGCNRANWCVSDHFDNLHTDLIEDEFYLYFHDNFGQYDYYILTSPIKQYVFGFDSLEKLNQWFCEKEIENLKKAKLQYSKI